MASGGGGVSVVPSSPVRPAGSGAVDGRREPLGPDPATVQAPGLPATATREPDPAPEPESENRGEGFGSLAARFKRPETLVSFGIAAAIVVFFVRGLDIDAGDVWANVRQVNPFLYALSLVVFYLGFIWRALRWRMMLGQTGIDAAHGYRLPNIAGLIEIYLLSWFANCLVPAKLGDAYRAFLLKKDSGAPFSTTVGTILAERLVDLVVLFLTMGVVGVAVFGSHLPGAAEQSLVFGVALMIVGLVGLGVMWWARDALARRVPARWQDQYARLHDAVFASLRRPAPSVLASLLIWLGDGLRLWFVALALGADVGLGTAVFVALMSALLTTVPFTPAGLGFVDVAMIGVLKLVGVDAAMAGSVALLDRVIGYWSIILLGMVLYARRARRDVR